MGVWGAGEDVLFDFGVDVPLSEYVGTRELA